VNRREFVEAIVVNLNVVSGYSPGDTEENNKMAGKPNHG
jgi:hypothetical protein